MRGLVCLLASCVLAGCAATPPTIDLAAGERAGLRVTNVEMELAENSSVFWADAEYQYGLQN